MDGQVICLQTGHPEVNAMIRPTVLPGHDTPASVKPQSDAKHSRTDAAVLKWRNTPFQERLDMLVDGKQPDWIQNPGSRISWLKHQLHQHAKGAEAPRDELTAADAPAPALLKPMGRPEAGPAPANVALETVAAQLSARVLAQRYGSADLADNDAGA